MRLIVANLCDRGSVTMVIVPFALQTEELQILLLFLLFVMIDKLT